MEQLKQRIIEDAIIINDSVVKVDSFLNHQMDILLFNEMGKAFRQHFNQTIDKIVTCEASGIGIACIAAQYFDCPVVFAKKETSAILQDNFYKADVYSYTKKKKSVFHIDKRFISKGQNILLIDDFLANGEAMSGLISIVEQAGAKVAGIGVAIEKGFQPGGETLRKLGYDLKSLVIIDEIKDLVITFRED